MKCDVQIDKLMEELSKFLSIKNKNFADTCVTHQFEKDIYHNRRGMSQNYRPSRPRCYT